MPKSGHQMSLRFVSKIVLQEALFISDDEEHASALLLLGCLGG